MRLPIKNKSKTENNVKRRCNSGRQEQVYVQQLKSL